MITVRHRAALLSALLAAAIVTLAVPAPASAVEPGFQVAITEIPDRFTAGAAARTVTIVASSNRRLCIKVRWSLTLEVNGLDLDQIQVSRIEDNGDFPVRVQSNGKTARITDVQVDPGQLCRGSTVTARYQVAFDEDTETGEVTFQGQAFTAAGTLLQQASEQSRVLGEEPVRTKSPTASPSPSPSASPEESEEADEVSEEATPEPAESEDDIAAVPASANGPSLLGPGLIIGGILVFLGVGLLLRLRMRTRAAEQDAALPTGFYPSH
jgi:hypothetical protein